MRADIHDGPEHMLQSETEYIDARPHQPASTKSLLHRAAGPYIGSIASISTRSPDVCLSPDSGGIADIPQPLLGARGGHPQLRISCSRTHLFVCPIDSTKAEANFLPPRPLGRHSARAGDRTGVAANWCYRLGL